MLPCAAQRRVRIQHLAVEIDAESAIEPRNGAGVYEKGTRSPLAPIEPRWKTCGTAFEFRNVA